MASGKSKKTGSNRKGASLHKRGVRKKFRARHIDQVGYNAFNAHIAVMYGELRAVALRVCRFGKT